MEAHKSITHLCLLLLVMALIVKVRCSHETRDATLTETPSEADIGHGKRNTSTYNNVVIEKKAGNYNGWGWGGGGGGGGGGGSGGGIGGGGGWGWGGGGGGWWGWGCRRQKTYNNHHRNHVHKNENKDYLMGEFAQCMGRGRCKWKRLDCPLHCGGACFYDCKHMCKAHCQR